MSPKLVCLGESAKDWVPLASSFLGGVLALGGHYIAQHFNGKNVLRSEQRVDGGVASGFTPRV